MTVKKKKIQNTSAEEIEYINAETISFRRSGNDKGAAIAMGIAVVLVFGVFITLFIGTIIEIVTGEISEVYIGCIVMGAIAIPLLVVYIVLLIRPFFLYEHLYFVNTDKKYAVTKTHKGHIFFYVIGKYKDKCYAYIDGKVIAHEYKDSNNKEGFCYLVGGLRKNPPIKDKKNGYSSSFSSEYANLKETNPFYYQHAAPGESRKDYYSYKFDDNLKPLYCKTLYRGKANIFLSRYKRKDELVFVPNKETEFGISSNAEFKNYKYTVLDFNSNNFMIDIPKELLTALIEANIITQDEKYIR